MLRRLAGVPRLCLVLAAIIVLTYVNPWAVPALADPQVTVTDGQTLGSIALQYYGDAGDAQLIADYNHLSDPDHLMSGQVLMLPPIGSAAAPASNREVTVTLGQTLGSIALAAYGDASDAQLIADYNHLSDPDVLTSGEVLKLPNLTVGPSAGAPNGSGATLIASISAAGSGSSQSASAQLGPVIQRVSQPGMARASRGR